MMPALKVSSAGPHDRRGRVAFAETRDDGPVRPRPAVPHRYDLAPGSFEALQGFEGVVCVIVVADQHPKGRFRCIAQRVQNGPGCWRPSLYTGMTTSRSGMVRVHALGTTTETQFIPPLFQAMEGGTMYSPRYPLRVSLGHEFPGDMPGEEQRVLGLVAEQCGLLEYGDSGARHVFSDFVRAPDFHDAVDNIVVEPGICDEGCWHGRERRCRRDAAAAGLDVPQQAHEGEFALHHVRGEASVGLRVEQAGPSFGFQLTRDGRVHAVLSLPGGEDADGAPPVRWGCV